MANLSGTSRARLALGEPPGDLTAFPGVAARRQAFRAHLDDRGPWWFASDPRKATQGGRFDLHDPEGTCYVASGVEAAVRERLGVAARGGRRLFDDPLLLSTAVAVLRAADRPKKGRVANTASKAAAGVVTRELSTTARYALTRRWARAFRGSGFAGIRYEPRFTPGSDTAEAWFGPTGAHELPFVPVEDWRDDVPIHTGVIDADRATIID